MARRDVMYNDFVIVGPPADPAGIAGTADAAAALKAIARAGAGAGEGAGDRGVALPPLPRAATTAAPM